MIKTHDFFLDLFNIIDVNNYEIISVCICSFQYSYKFVNVNQIGIWKSTI
jgi:hypothetical protein